MVIGWSLGGLYAREMARAAPDKVRAVVTLGSPVWGDRRRYTNVWKLYERIAGHPVDNPPIRDRKPKPPVPTLAIWSRRDGIVAALLGARHRGDLRPGGRGRFDPHGLRGVEEGHAPGGGEKSPGFWRKSKPPSCGVDSCP